MHGIILTTKRRSICRTKVPEAVQTFICLSMQGRPVLVCGQIFHVLHENTESLDPFDVPCHSGTNLIIRNITENKIEGNRVDSEEIRCVFVPNKKWIIFSKKKFWKKKFEKKILKKKFEKKNFEKKKFFFSIFRQKRQRPWINKTLQYTCWNSVGTTSIRGRISRHWFVFRHTLLFPSMAMGENGRNKPRNSIFYKKKCWIVDFSWPLVVCRTFCRILTCFSHRWPPPSRLRRHKKTCCASCLPLDISTFSSIMRPLNSGDVSCVITRRERPASFPMGHHWWRYEDMPQSLRTPMLFNGWLIDWVRGHASKSAHPHVIQWLIDRLSTRTCLKVCALPSYSMVDWSIEYEDMPQSLRTPMLFNGWLIDWVRGHASKSAHSHVIQWLIDRLSTRTCLKVCALPCYSMVDWSIEYEYTFRNLRTPFLSQSLRTLKIDTSGKETDQIRPISNPPMGIVIMLCMKQKRRQNPRWFPTKKWKKSTSNVHSINQSTIE